MADYGCFSDPIAMQRLGNTHGGYMANWGPADDARYLHVLRAGSGKHFIRQPVKNMKGIIQQMNSTLPINTV